jgi:hypothetical protein
MQVYVPSAGVFSAPIVALKFHHEPSVFRPENMLREARRQKGLTTSPVPHVCVLDPDVSAGARAHDDLRRLGMLPHEDARI